MELPGDELDCPHCGGTHVVREDESGFSPGLGFRKLYVECPAVNGVVVWALVDESSDDEDDDDEDDDDEDEYDKKEDGDDGDDDADRDVSDASS